MTCRLLLSTVFALGLAGCSSCSREEPQGKPAVSSIAPPINARLEPIPTEEDFEEEAIREVTSEKLDTELDRLTQEIKP